MRPVDALRAYFAGERSLGWVLLALGVVAVLVAIAAWRRRADPLYKGLLVPMLLLALGGLLGGPMLASRSQQQSDELGAMIERAPLQLKEQELLRMQAVNRNWRPLEITWVTLIVVGSALALRKRGTWRGVAIGVVAIAATLLTIDLTAERRAEHYTAMLRSL